MFPRTSVCFGIVCAICCVFQVVWATVPLHAVRGIADPVLVASLFVLGRCTSKFSRSSYLKLILNSYSVESTFVCLVQIWGSLV